MHARLTITLFAHGLSSAAGQVNYSSRQSSTSLFGGNQVDGLPPAFNGAKHSLLILTLSLSLGRANLGPEAFDVLQCTLTMSH